MSLSDRLRPNIEAAPWVIEEVKKLEVELHITKDMLDSCDQYNQRLKEELKQQKEFEAADRADVKALTIGFETLRKENDHLKHIIRSYKNFMTEIAIQADAALFMSKETDKE